MMYTEKIKYNFASNLMSASKALMKILYQQISHAEVNNRTVYLTKLLLHGQTALPFVIYPMN